MKTTMERVTVALSSNDSYAMLMGVSLCSLFENKKGDYPIDIYVIDSKISAKNKAHLAVLEKRYGFSITYVDPAKELFDKIPLDELSSGYRVPMENYHRLSVGRFLPLTCHKVINLDADTVVRGDIAELFNVDLKEKTMGIVADADSADKKERIKKICKERGMANVPDDFLYLNSGILLIDLDLWRSKRIEEQLLKVMREEAGKLRYHDQDALNIVLMGDCEELSPKYNFLAAQFDEKDCPDPLIVHFVGGGKPWYFLSALPYQKEYVHYANMTPWKSEKYRKFMDIHFAKKYGIYSIAWGLWSAYKKLKRIVQRSNI